MAADSDYQGVPPSSPPAALAALLDPTHLRDEILKRWDAFADTAVKTAAGTLALTVTFRSSVAEDEPQATWLLILAWCALALVPIAAAAAHAIHAALNQLLLFAQVRGAQLSLVDEKRITAFETRFVAVGTIAHFSMIIGFGAGMAAFVTFACLNV